MTREEAIKILKAIKVYECYPKSASEETKEAIDMAIEALSVEEAVWNEYEAEFTDLPDIPRYYYEKVVGKMAHEINMLREQLDSADAVSRKAKCCPIAETCMSIDCPVSSEYIGRPSAEAVQGEWIEKYNGNGWNDFWDYTCSNCGKKYERADAVLYHANYCPNCGARMKGGAE